MTNKDILLKLKRKITDNEVIKLLQAELSKCQLEIGVLKSENAELRHELEQRRLEVKRLTKKKTLDPTDERIQVLTKRVESRDKRIKMLEKDLNTWISKVANLMAKYEKGK